MGYSGWYCFFCRIVSLLVLASLPGFPALSGEAPVADDRAAQVQPEADHEWLRRAEPDSIVCPFRNRIDYDHGEIECGLIEVPENRETAASRSLELHYVRIAAQVDDDEAAREDPVIYLTGGPGVAVGGYVERLKDHPILERRDLYILEQRGIGSSGEFCTFSGQRNRADRVKHEFEESLRAGLEDARDCARNAKAQGIDLSAYNTWENARDVRSLRLALGYEDWNVWGISYGSHLGQALMHVDPVGTRAVVLDAIVPNDLFGMGLISEWYQRDLDKLFEACEQQSGCARHYPELEQRFLAAIEDLAETPETVELDPDERYPEGKATVFHNIIGGLPFSLLYEQDQHPAIPAIMDGFSEVVADRDENFFRAIPQVDTSGGFESSAGMSLAVRCNDGYTARAAEMAEEQAAAHPVISQVFGTPAIARESAELCEDMGMAPRPRIQYQPIVSSLAALVVNGAWDPITPPPMARHILPGLFNARYVEFPHAGHGPTRSVECAGDFMNDFFDDPEAELDWDCVEDGEDAAEYIAPYFATDGPRRAFLAMQEDEEGLRNHAAWAGTTLAFVVIGGLAITGGFIGRRINRTPIRTVGGSRLLTLLAVLGILAWLGGMAAAAHATAEVTEALFLFGFVSWASLVAWLAPLSVILAVAGTVQTIRYRELLPSASLVGLILTALGVIGTALVGLVWNLWPF